MVHVIFLVTEDALLACTSKMPIVHVAFGAGNRVMHAAQSEVFVEVIDLSPTIFVMAIGTTYSERSVVSVFVAFGAGGGNRGIANHGIRFVLESHHLTTDRLVAIFALRLFVLTFERKHAVDLVIKLGCLPAFFQMAL